MLCSVTIRERTQCLPVKIFSHDGALASIVVRNRSRAGGQASRGHATGGAAVDGVRVGGIGGVAVLVGVRRVEVVADLMRLQDGWEGQKVVEQLRVGALPCGGVDVIFLLYWPTMPDIRSAWTKTRKHVQKRPTHHDDHVPHQALGFVRLRGSG